MSNIKIPPRFYSENNISIFYIDIWKQSLEIFLNKKDELKEILI